MKAIDIVKPHKGTKIEGFNMWINGKHTKIFLGLWNAKKIEVTYPQVRYFRELEDDRECLYGRRLPVKVTSPCKYCNKPVTYTRGAVFSGSDYHQDCYVKSGDQKRHADAFQESICGDLTPAEYQRKHGVAWNE